MLEDISNDRGGEAVVDGFQFKVVLTVPAIWTQAANARMKAAAKKAGITRRRVAGETLLHLVPEPEAAALATLSEIEYTAKVGDVFVICDVGGGTADLISYRIENVRPLEVAEYVSNKGKLCGAIFVDEAFKNYIHQTLPPGSLKKMGDEGIEKLLSGEWEM